MASEKAVGALMLIVSILVIVFYFIWIILAPFMLNPQSIFWNWGTLWGIPIPPLYWLIVIPMYLLLLIGGIILAWIGLALVQAPEPTEINIEEIEKELEDLEKEEEKAEEKEEEESEKKEE
ncbi:MAG: hypothetical protein ACP6IP_09600 [Candidatus Njordarchaeia archaeon]